MHRPRIGPSAPVGARPEEDNLPSNDATINARLPRAERREQLLATAQGAFVESGYHATSMDEIAERAGVSKPVLYQHFDGKLELYLGLLETQSDLLISQLEAALTSSEDNAERITATVRAYFEFADAPNGAHRLLFETDLVSEPAVRQLLDRPYRACADAVARLIVEDTGLPFRSAQLLGVSLVGMAQACAQQWVSEGRPTPLEEAVDLVATVAWRGLGRFPLNRAETSAD
ncbi:TetR/AcrR family transcriptional regulator [Ornithinimicrobium ciconiae]|uniref:TetR/AcrR family transcriptional regulator n=1 Tax=Ornithinimicrobium ciconiae TaxID=2594265 RepID=UPI001D17E907|nr:TetR/AcrR family transcriptional regulator [Ornithinimicrobium ciconiae]